jgi:hypothetical protein
MRNSNVEPDDSGTGAPSIRGRRAAAHLPAAVLLAALVAAAAVGLAACGGGGSTSSATTAGGGPNGSSASYQRALEYARCMRTHGVPNFPDPQSNGSFAINTHEVNMTSPQFKSAQNDCRSLASGPPSQAQQAQAFAAALKFSRCMRAHGLPDFPDPKQGSNGLISGSVVGAKSPQFQRASQACRSDFPGLPVPSAAP